MLTVRSVFVADEGATCLYLRVENGIPQLLGGNHLSSATLLFIALIQSFKLITIDFMEVQRLVRREQGPVTILFDSLHAVENVRDDSNRTM